MAAYDTATSRGFENAGHALIAGAVVLISTGVGAPVATGVEVVGVMM
ncbi:MAG TPA: hypothetical protein VKZ56_02260 [Membranihabitans sp.]|jgi:hypothetical protein|nr:hypothetical protein [Membranihabitans sp.]